MDEQDVEFVTVLRCRGCQAVLTEVGHGERLENVILYARAAMGNHECEEL